MANVDVTGNNIISSALVRPTGAGADKTLADAVRAASDTVSGVVELATNDETVTGTDTARAVTPAGAAYAYKKSIVTEAGTSRTNVATDRVAFVLWTNTAAKTYTLAANVAAAGEIWNGFNNAATGDITIVAGAGVTLSGYLLFNIYRAYTIVWTSATTAVVIGGVTAP